MPPSCSRYALTHPFLIPSLITTHIQLRFHFDPTILLQSFIYGATECTIGYGYDAVDLTLFKMEYFEYLPVERPRGVAELKQEVRNPFFLIVIINSLCFFRRCSDASYLFLLSLLYSWSSRQGNDTKDRLRRYRLGDVATVAGFCPVDGQPVLRYCERQQYVFHSACPFSIMF